MIVIAADSRADLLRGDDGWVSRSESGASWKEYFHAAPVTECAANLQDSIHVRRTNDLPRHFDSSEQQALRCYSLHVRNASAVMLQCSAVVEQTPVPGGAGPRVEGDAVVFPKMMTSVVRFIGSASELPAKFSTRCFLVPETPPPLAKPAAKCGVTLHMPAKQDFYPVISDHLGEHGDVLLEYGVQSGSDALQDVRIVGSSHSWNLDAAALGMAREGRVRGGCPNTRYRTVVSFVASTSRAREPSGSTAIQDVPPGR